MLTPERKAPFAGVAIPAAIISDATAAILERRFFIINLLVFGSNEFVRLAPQKEFLLSPGWSGSDGHFEFGGRRACFHGCAAPATSPKSVCKGKARKTGVPPGIWKSRVATAF